MTTQPIIFLSSDKDDIDAIEDSHILVILRNMAGHSIPLAVKKTAIFWDVRHHVAIQMGLVSSDIHLMLDYNELEDLTRIYTVQPLLESKCNVIDFLVDKQELKFNCIHCQRECDLWECVDWSDHTDHMCCYGQWQGVHE
jgi:hypothetical protein